MAMLARWLIMLGLWSLASGCSDFLLNASATNVISARTMDFSLDLNTVVTTVPVGSPFQEQSGHSWTNKFGFLSFNVATLPFAMDGLNTKGLSASWLYMSDTVYPTTNPLDSTNRPIVSNLCSYILGNFATIEDVKRGIRLIQPTGIDLTQIGLTLHAGLGPLRTLPLHVAIHDASGASMAIEFLDGTMHLIDNPLGVLTNDPPLSVQLDRLAAASLHEGVPSGMSSTDRFVRLAKYNHVSSQDTYDVQTSFTAASSVDQSGVTRALHLLNTVVQPIISPTFATEWIVIRDHQNLHVYFQSTENSVLRRIDLNTVDWMDPTHRKTWPVASTASPWYIDVENEFEVIVG